MLPAHRRDGTNEGPETGWLRRMPLRGVEVPGGEVPGPVRALGAVTGRDRVNRGIGGIARYPSGDGPKVLSGDQVQHWRDLCRVLRTVHVAIACQCVTHA